MSSIIGEEGERRKDLTLSVFLDDAAHLLHDAAQQPVLQQLLQLCHLHGKSWREVKRSEETRGQGVPTFLSSPSTSRRMAGRGLDMETWRARRGVAGEEAGDEAGVRSLSGATGGARKPTESVRESDNVSGSSRGWGALRSSKNLAVGGRRY